MSGNQEVVAKLSILLSLWGSALASARAEPQRKLTAYENAAFLSYVKDAMGPSKIEADYRIKQKVFGNYVSVSISPRRHEPNRVGGVSRFGYGVRMVFRNGSLAIVRKYIST